MFITIYVLGVRVIVSIPLILELKICGAFAQIVIVYIS
jgi:hypothetical protein